MGAESLSMVYSVQQLIPVRTLQSSKCLGADGVVSPLSWGSGDHGATAAMPGVFRKNSNFAINLATPSRSTGGWGLQTPDGQRGSRFQHALSLDIPSVAADGIVGPITWRALVSGMLAG